ncbi:hypothetical protein KAH55_02290 [bacterium]|nr:hypothetical protein [bacterium]
MVRQILRFTVAFVFMFSLVSVATAEINTSLADYYQEFGGNSAEKNLEDNVLPILKTFGFQAGSGLYNSADLHSVLGIDINLHVTILNVNDALKTGWDGPVGTKDGPLGDESNIILPAFQAGIGLPINLDLFVRYYPTKIMKNPAGGTEIIPMMGVGFKYGLIQSLLLPKVCLVGAYNRHLVPDSYDFSDVSTASIGLAASKSLPLLATIYGGVGMDWTTISVDMAAETFDYQELMFRGLVGVKISLLPFISLYADYNFGELSAYSAGLGFSFR